jgi:hypothetical protein
LKLEVHQRPHGHAAVLASAYKPPRASRLFFPAHFIVIFTLVIPFVGITTIIINNVILSAGARVMLMAMAVARSHRTRMGKTKRL